MFDPNNYKAIENWTDKDLELLPKEEDDRHEYKGSAISDDDLAKEISKMASGFWNSGGGLLAAGINDAGKVDGGIRSCVGNQPRRDWIDRELSKISHRGPCAVRCIESGAGKVVALLGFGASEAVPHMAHDGRYYIRLGKHTDPASHFIVESLWARRHFGRPSLIHLLEMRGLTQFTGVFVLEVVSITDSPALDVQIDFDPRPTKPEPSRLPLRCKLIDGTHPIAFPCELQRQFPTQLSIKYTDMAGNPYEYTASIQFNDYVPPSSRSTLRDVVDAINGLNSRDE